MAGLGPGRRRGEKVFDGYLRKVLDETDGGTEYKKAEQIVRKLVDNAMQGDMASIKECLDRMDGKPAQSVDVGGPDGGEIVFKTIVEMVKG